MPEVRKLDHETALYTATETSPHVAIGQMGLSDGAVYEIITVDRAFLMAALEDARSWCHELEGTSSAKPGRLAEYDEALVVLR